MGGHTGSVRCKRAFTYCGVFRLVRSRKHLGRQGDLGRTPEAGLLRWVASQDLKVVIWKVLSRRPAFVAVGDLSVYGYIGAPLQG